MIVGGAQGVHIRAPEMTCLLNALTRTIHDRMPVLLDKADFGAWLSGAAGTELLRPAAEDRGPRAPTGIRNTAPRGAPRRRPSPGFWRMIRCPASTSIFARWPDGKISVRRAYGILVTSVVKAHKLLSVFGGAYHARHTEGFAKCSYSRS
jgi:hypothetical protein